MVLNFYAITSRGAKIGLKHFYFDIIIINPTIVGFFYFSKIRKNHQNDGKNILICHQNDGNI